MDIRNIQTFLRICDLENFTKAAASLNFAQSTVTVQIRQLEKELGFPLFDRNGKKVQLTAPGKEFLPLAKDMVNIHQQASAINQSATELHGSFLIGAHESLLNYTLADILAEYKQIYPNVDVQVKTGNRSDLISWLDQNYLDMLYISSDENNNSHLHCGYKRTEFIVFVAGKEHPLANRARVTLQEALSFPSVDTERTGYCYERLKTLATAQNLPLAHSLAVESIPAILKILKSGKYISFLPEYSVEEYIAADEVVKIPVEIEPQTHYSQILYQRDKWVPPYMQGLINLIRKHRPER